MRWDDGMGARRVEGVEMWEGREWGIDRGGTWGVGMADTQLGDAGGSALAEALRTNTTLTTLHLSCE